MFKIFIVLFVLLVCNSLNIGKAEESEEKTDNNDNTKSNNEEDESASIQVVQMDVVTVKVEKSLNNDDNPHIEENYTEVSKNINSTKFEDKEDAFFEDLISDSRDTILDNRDDSIEETPMTGVVSIKKNIEYNNQQDKIATILKNNTDKAYNKDEKSQEDSTIADENENNSRNAESFHSGDKKYENEAANEASVEDDTDYSVDDYMDKKMDLEVKGRMDTRKPERRQYFNTRQIDVRHYEPLENHGILDSGHMRNFNEMMVPRYRPVLTRSGIVYTPTLFPMQTGSPILDKLSGRNWVPNRVNMNPQAEAFKTRHNIGVSQYEDSKNIDDYNDYGSNTNTYSYTPVRKVTTQAPPQQIVVPSKGDVFQKLVEASNHPNSQKRAFNEFPGNYHPIRQYLS